MIGLFEKMFGNHFWNNVIIGISRLVLVRIGNCEYKVFDNLNFAYLQSKFVLHHLSINLCL